MLKIVLVLGLIAVCSAVPVVEKAVISEPAVAVAALPPPPPPPVGVVAVPAVEPEAHIRAARSPLYYYAAPSYLPYSRGLYSADALWASPSYYI